MFKFRYAAWAAGLVVPLLSAPLEIRAADPQADLLQGAWTLVSTEQDGKVTSALADPFTLVVSGSIVRLRNGEELVAERRRHPGQAGDPDEEVDAIIAAKGAAYTQAA